MYAYRHDINLQNYNFFGFRAFYPAILTVQGEKEDEITDLKEKDRWRRLSYGEIRLKSH